MPGAWGSSRWVVAQPLYVVVANKNTSCSWLATLAYVAPHDHLPVPRHFPGRSSLLRFTQRRGAPQYRATGSLVSGVALAPQGQLPTISVVICAYTLRRWDMLEAAIASCLDQTTPPEELLVCIDHNPELLARCQAAAPEWCRNSTVVVTVVPNSLPGRLGSARTTALHLARGEVVAFLDDDAVADPDWLRILVQPFVQDAAVAVGGAPLAVFHAPEPRWFPPQFRWVFGCAYAGLPDRKAPLAHLIGANMAARRDALVAIGGFHSDNHDDMDMCHRLAHRYPENPILYEPQAVVYHNVTSDRLSWQYFWHRCFFVNRGKVQALRGMEDAANLTAEVGFVLGSARGVVVEAVRRTRKGDPFGAIQLLVFVVGVVLAGAGHLSGRLWPERLGPMPSELNL